MLGARPQFTKASVVSPYLSDLGKEILVHTGQHFDQNMSDVFFEGLKMRQPDYFLDINGRYHGLMTGRMMIELEKTVLIEKPDCMLLYGDTNSTLAGALVASKLHIPIAHIEAGERSFNRKMPEEINSVITDHLSSFHFATSLNAQNNLLKEGISAEKLSVVGDVMYDLAIKISNTLKDNEDFKVQDSAGKNKILPSHFALVTIHRAENTDNPEHLRTIFEALFKVTFPQKNGHFTKQLFAPQKRQG